MIIFSCLMQEAFGRKLFKNFISTAQSKEALLPHLRSFCCYQEDWYRADMMEMFKRYGQPDNEFDAAVTCACSDRVLVSIVNLFITNRCHAFQIHIEKYINIKF